MRGCNWGDRNTNGFRPRKEPSPDIHCNSDLQLRKCWDVLCSENSRRVWLFPGSLRGFLRIHVVLGPLSRGFGKGWFPKGGFGRVFPGLPKPEQGHQKNGRWYQKPERRHQNRNNGTKNRNEGTFAKTAFYKTSLLFPPDSRTSHTRATSKKSWASSGELPAKPPQPSERLSPIRHLAVLLSFCLPSDMKMLS